MPKRRKTADAENEETDTPRKSRKRDNGEEATATPSRGQSILKGIPRKDDANDDAQPTPRSLRRVLFSTPNKADEIKHGEEETPTADRNDRSARRKSARMLQKQLHGDVSEDEDGLEQEAALAEEILGGEESDEEGDDDNEEEEEEEESNVTVKPSTTPSKRGRPKGKRRERTPSPPPHLPPHELYFFQNRTGGNKTSANIIPSQLLLKHEDFFTHIKAYRDPHEADIKQLQQYHRRAFDQWLFELEEGYNLCLYGYGSKRALIMQFAEYMSTNHTETKAKIVVVNGYAPALTARDILTTLAGVILPKNTKVPAQPTPLLDLLLASLAENASSAPIRLIIHSIDHTNLRKANTRSILARLAAHDRISLLATCDTPHFPLLWDTSLLRQFRWLYHDSTTFQPYTAELDAVEEVNVLLSRTSRRLGGKDGVGYVLKSLPENARNLFRILVAEQLASVDAEPHAVPGAVGDDFDAEDFLGAEDEEEALAQQDTPSKRKRGRPAKAAKAVKPMVSVPAEGVEYRTLYHKAVEEFVCSSELNFRTLLKEFHDHQMIESRKDALGTERLIVPFRREELETILEELV